MPLPITKERVEALLIQAGHAINANNGRCELIEDCLCKFTTLCTDLLARLDDERMARAEEDYYQSNQ